MKIHVLKCWPEMLSAILEGRKTHEARGDRLRREFKVGDVLWLREYLPTSQTYGHRHVHVEVTYVTEPHTPVGISLGMPDDLVVMSIARVDSHVGWRHVTTTGWSALQDWQTLEYLRQVLDLVPEQLETMTGLPQHTWRTQPSPFGIPPTVLRRLYDLIQRPLAKAVESWG